MFVGSTAAHSLLIAVRHKGTDFASERLHNQQQEAQQTRVRDYNTLEDEKICQTHGYGIEQRDRVMKHVRKDVVKTNRCPSHRFWTLGSSPGTSVRQVVQGIASKLPANTWKGKKGFNVCVCNCQIVCWSCSMFHDRIFRITMPFFLICCLRWQCLLAIKI